MSAVTVSTDAEREREIDIAYRLMCNATRPEDMQRHCDEMCALVRQRSPAQVKRMERERRLRR